MMAAVSAEFRAGLPQRMAGIDELWRQVSGTGDCTQPMAELILALHMIAGSAATFGMDAVGQAAAAAESRLEPYRGSAPAPDAAAQAEITLLLEALHRVAGIAAEGQG